MSRPIVLLCNSDLTFDIRTTKTLIALTSKFKVLVFYNGSNSNFEILDKLENLKTINVKDEIKSNFVSKHFLIGNTFHSSYSYISEWLLKNNVQPSMFYSVDLPTFKTGYKLSKKFNCKLVYDAYEIYVETFNQYYPLEIKNYKTPIFLLMIFLAKHINKWRERKYMKKVSLFITTCDSFLDYFLSSYNINQSLIIRNTPYFVDYKEITAIDLHNTFNISKNKKIIIYTGTFNAGRSLDKLLLSALYLPNNFHLLFIGFGPLKNYLESLVVKNSLAGKVSIHGPYDMSLTLNYIKGADLGVLFTDATNISKYLASANKVYDYMMAGVPLLLSNTPENQKIIQLVGNGKFINEIKPEIISNQIVEIINSDKKDTFIQQGLKYASSDGNYQIDEKKLVNSIADLLK
jgi:glycosyltransferase involved in cell wall biosynthesis